MRFDDHGTTTVDYTLALYDRDVHFREHIIVMLKKIVTHFTDSSALVFAEMSVAFHSEGER